MTDSVMARIRMDCVIQAVIIKQSGDSRDVVDIAREIMAFVLGDKK